MDELEQDPVTLWIARLKQGDARAPEVIWEHYFQQLIQLGKRRLQSASNRMNNEEDLALSAMNSFFEGVQNHRFSQLDNREELWKVLATIAVRKAVKYYRAANAQRRPDAHMANGSSTDDQNVDEICQVLGREPSPEMAAMFAEAVQSRLNALPDETLRQIAIWKLHGLTNREIAVQLYPDISQTKPKTAQTNVERKLAAIRRLWTSQDETECPTPKTNQ